MAGQFVLEGGRAEVVEGDDDEPETRREVFEEYVKPVKFVHNVFFDIDGSAEVWCELELGNEHPEKSIRIQEVHFGFNEIGQDSDGIRNIGVATTSVTDSDGEEPLLLESSEESRQDTKWHEMYDEFVHLDDSGDGYFGDDKRPDENDCMFRYQLGAGENHQHIYTTPVTFEVDTRDGENTEHSYVLQKVRTLSDRNADDGESPLIRSDADMLERIDDEQFSCTSRAVDGDDAADGDPSPIIDTVSIWLYWEEDDLCVPKDDISYHFRYAVDCDFQRKEFTHIYPHYILPEESVLMGQALLMESLSEARVEEFHPPEKRWMFKEWENEYDVEDMSSARMTRSKEKGTSHVFNSGRIGFPALRARQTVLQFVLVILSGWAVQHTFSQPVPSNPGWWSLVQHYWPIVIVPVSTYLLAKGHGPPPYFPKFLRSYIVPAEEYVFGPAGRSLNRLGRLPFQVLGGLRDAGASALSWARDVLRDRSEADAPREPPETFPDDARYERDPADFERSREGDS